MVTRDATLADTVRGEGLEGASGEEPSAPPWFPLHQVIAMAEGYRMGLEASRPRPPSRGREEGGHQRRADHVSCDE